MDPQAGASFIPKQALEKRARAARPAGMGLFMLIGIFLFFASLIVAGAAWAYEHELEGSIAQKSQSLTASENAFDPGAIQNLVRTDSRLTQAQLLLNQHVAPSALFGLVAQLTLPEVQFTSFSYSLNGDGSAQLTLGGVADSFSTVALESDQFGDASSSLKDVIFSDIAVAQDGSVSFTINATALASVLSYRTFIAAESDATQASAPTPTASSTTP